MKTSTVYIGIAAWALWRASATHPSLNVEAYTSVSAEVCDGHEQDIPPRILEDDQIAAYRKDGFIVLKGVLQADLADQLAQIGYALVDRASRFPQFFSVIENGLIFNGGGMLDDHNDHHRHHYNNEDARIFREVALYSDIPQIAAELMELDRKTQNLRVLR
jgi:hypothetical protein